MVELTKKKVEIAAVHREMKQKNAKGKAGAKYSLPTHQYHIKHFCSFLTLISSHFLEGEEDSETEVKLEEEEREIYESICHSVLHQLKEMDARVQKGVAVTDEELFIVQSVLSLGATIFQKTYQMSTNRGSGDMNITSLHIVEYAMSVEMTQETTEEAASFLKKTNLELAEESAVSCMDKQICNFEEIAVMTNDARILPIFMRIIAPLGRHLDDQFREKHSQWLEEHILREATSATVQNTALEVYLNINQKPLRAHAQLATEFRVLMGECDQRLDPPTATLSYSLDHKGITKLISTFLNSLTILLGEVDGAISLLKSPHRMYTPCPRLLDS